MLLEGYDYKMQSLDFMTMLGSDSGYEGYMTEADLEQAIDDIHCEVEWIAVLAHIRYIVLSSL